MLVLPVLKARLVLKARRVSPAIKASWVQSARLARPVPLVFRAFRASRATRVIAATSAPLVPKVSKASKATVVIKVSKALRARRARLVLLVLRPLFPVPLVLRVHKDRLAPQVQHQPLPVLKGQPVRLDRLGHRHTRSLSAVVTLAPKLNGSPV